MTHYFLSIALLSSSIIAYEVALVRLFSIAQWHHFAQMIISLALLGFGASGTVISLTQRWLSPRFHAVYTISGIIYSISIVCCFVLSQYVPFNPFMLVWQPSQALSLFVMYLILSFPFFFGGTCIGLALLKFTESVNQLYFFDLLGAGAGALGVIFTMYVIPPAQNLNVISAIGFCSILIANLGRWQEVHWQQIVLIVAIASTFLGYLQLKPISINISPYKGLSGTLNFSDAKILSERHSPLGVLHVVRSQSIHAASGLSLSSQHSIPPQLGLFTDADEMTVITDFGGDLSRLAYLDDTTSALAYHLLEKPCVLVLRSGAGGEVLNALYHGVASVDAVEINSQVIDLVAREHGDFAGHIYALDSDYPVQVHMAEAREFMRSTAKKYNLIQITLLDSASALSESYLYTVEAISELFQHLLPGGMVSITYGELKTPPRGMIRLFATVVEALERLDGPTSAQQLTSIRGLTTGTLLMKNGIFRPNERKVIQNFCHERSFDMVYYPEMAESEANHYNQLIEPTYFRAAQAILSHNRERFYQQYPFDIRPVTDNRPYFFQFLRLDSLIQMVRTIGRNALPFIEWGYPLLVTSLIQAVLAGFILILSPLFFLQRRSSFIANYEDGTVCQGATHSASKTVINRQTTSPQAASDEPVPQFAPWRACSYFLSLGVGFMLIEIAFIQKFLLLLADPTYAVAVVLCAFLVFAGFGSLFSPKLAQAMRRDGKLLRRRNPIPVAIGILSLIALLYIQLLPWIFHHFLASPASLKIILSILLIAPLAFFMGMPFPFGINLLQRRNPDLIAWAWGINGYASVVSAIFATCLAIAFGFNTVILVAIGIYLMGACVVPH